MTLDAWLKSLPIEMRARAIQRIAKRCEVTTPAVRHWRNGTRRIPAEKCQTVVDESGGLVTLSCLRADVWPPVNASKRGQRVKKVA